MTAGRLKKKRKRNLINFNRIEFQFSNSAIKRQNVAAIVYIRQFVMTKMEKNVFSPEICKTFLAT